MNSNNMANNGGNSFGAAPSPTGAGNNGMNNGMVNPYFLFRLFLAKLALPLPPRTRRGLVGAIDVLPAADGTRLADRVPCLAV